MKLTIIVEAGTDGFRFRLTGQSRRLVQKLGTRSLPECIFVSYETRMHFEEAFGKSVLVNQVPILLIGLSKAVLQKHVAAVEYVDNRGRVIKVITF
jgi:hypothetical protein